MERLTMVVFFGSDTYLRLGLTALLAACSANISGNYSSIQMTSQPCSLLGIFWLLHWLSEIDCNMYSGNYNYRALIGSSFHLLIWSKSVRTMPSHHESCRAIYIFPEFVGSLQYALGFWIHVQRTFHSCCLLYLPRGCWSSGQRWEWEVMDFKSHSCHLMCTLNPDQGMIPLLIQVAPTGCAEIKTWLFLSIPLFNENSVWHFCFLIAF